jgi:hypothetical protein
VGRNADSSDQIENALANIRERRAGLEVYLDDPGVAIDTNHLERALRVIPMGRRNWLFAWTELGAKHTGIVQPSGTANVALKSKASAGFHQTHKHSQLLTQSIEIRYCTSYTIYVWSERWLS